MQRVLVPNSSTSARKEDIHKRLQHKFPTFHTGKIRSSSIYPRRVVPLAMLKIQFPRLPIDRGLWPEDTSSEIPRRIVYLLPRVSPHPLQFLSKPKSLNSSNFYTFILQLVCFSHPFCHFYSLKEASNPFTFPPVIPVLRKNPTDPLILRRANDSNRKHISCNCAPGVQEATCTPTVLLLLVCRG